MSEAPHSASDGRVEITVDPLSQELAAILNEHINKLEGFRDVATLVEGLPSGTDGWMMRVLDSLPRFSDPAKAEAFMASIRAVGGLLVSTVTSVDGDDDPALEVPPDLESTGSDLAKVTLQRDEAGEVRGGSISFEDSDVEHLIGLMLADSIEAALGPSRQEIVRSSLLTSIVGSFDSLVGDLAALFFRTHPGALGEEREFSLADLADFTSLEDAREDLIRRKVDSLDRGLDNHAQWFKSHLTIDLSRLAIDWVKVREIVQRRHLLVHSGGRISRRYIEKTEASDVVLGEVLAVEAEYLQAAVDEFIALGSNLVFATWVSLLPKHDAAADALLSAARRAARHERWEIVRSHAEVARKLDEPQRVVLEFQVLSWLASKKLGGSDAIQEEVETWDVSTLDERWKLARLCLLDDLDGAATTAAHLIRKGDIAATVVLLDPLYRDLRKHPLVATEIEARGVSPEIP